MRKVTVSHSHFFRELPRLMYVVHLLFKRHAAAILQRVKPLSRGAFRLTRVTIELVHAYSEDAIARPLVLTALEAASLRAHPAVFSRTQRVQVSGLATAATTASDGCVIIWLLAKVLAIYRRL